MNFAGGGIHVFRNGGVRIICVDDRIVGLEVLVVVCDFGLDFGGFGCGGGFVGMFVL